MVNMLRAPAGEVDKMEEQWANVSRQMKLLRKTHKEMPEIKNTEQKCRMRLMDSFVDGHDGWKNVLKDIQAETSKLKSKDKKRLGWRGQRTAGQRPKV